MALKDLLDLSTKHQKVGLSVERVEAIVPAARQYIAFWREYPDLMVDFMVRGTRQEERENEFHFYFYQRVFLRVVMRYQYVYAVFPRAYSKSFLSMMALMCRCILYPRINLFVTSGGKEQAAQILKDKINEICTLIPAFNKEIDWRRGKTQEGKDYCKYIFKSGSTLENMAARESSRGKRKHGGLIEECVGVDDQILREVIIPTMAISRRCLDGTTQATEAANKSQVFVTTAGYKGTFPYERLIGFLVRMVTQPERCFVMGGTWRLPVEVGLQSKTFISDQREEGTFNEASFGREYESIWTGDVEDAFFSSEAFDRGRILRQPEYEASGRSSKNQYYILAVDVGRKDCNTEVMVLKVTPAPMGPSIKSLVNIYSLEQAHFGDQALELKKLYYKYNARRLVIDGNGLGIGLMDYMVKPSIDPDTNDTIPDFGVYGGTYEDADNEFKKYETKDCERNAIYVIKANAPINTEAHTTTQMNLTSGKIKFLIDEKDAKQKLLGTKVGQAMKPEDRSEYLKPFTLTSILREEMLNLREENEGINIFLKKANKRIKSDKFSALEYGLYYIKVEEEDRKKKKKFNAKDWLFFN